MHPEIMAIGALGAVSAGAFGWFFSWYATFGGTETLVIAIAFALIYISFLTLRMLVTESRTHTWILIVCDLILFFLPFINNLSIWLFVIAGIAHTWLYLAWREGRAQTANMIHIRLKDFSHGFIKSAFRAVLFLGIATYLSFVDPNRIAISRALITTSLNNMMNSANRGVVEQIVGRSITAEESNIIIQTITNSVHTITETFITKIPPKAKTGLVIGLGVIVFLLASSFINLFMPFVMGFVWCVLQLLLKFNFITITTEKTDKETIVL